MRYPAPAASPSAPSWRHERKRKASSVHRCNISRSRCCNHHTDREWYSGRTCCKAARFRPGIGCRRDLLCTFHRSRQRHPCICPRNPVCTVPILRGTRFKESPVAARLALNRDFHGGVVIGYLDVGTSNNARRLRPIANVLMVDGDAGMGAVPILDLPLPSPVPPGSSGSMHTVSGSEDGDERWRRSSAFADQGVAANGGLGAGYLQALIGDQSRRA